jgi:hypothetical protein
VIPDGADGDRHVGESPAIRVDQPAAAMPTSEFLEDDLFDVVRGSRIA